MEPGKLRHRVEIFYPTTVTGTDGGATQTWTLQSTVWAEIRTVSGYEKELARQIGVDVATHEIWLRYFPTLTAAAKLVEGTHSYQIEACSDPDGTRRMHKCLCREIV